MESSVMTYTQWNASFSYIAGNLWDYIKHGKDLYDKWYDYTYGLSDADIAALPVFAGENITEAQITTLRVALEQLSDIYGAMSNVAVAQKDRKVLWVPLLFGASE
jgi:hypothetical protein